MQFIRRNLTWLILLNILLGVTNVAVAQDQPIITNDKRVALKGYDPVAYFTDNKPDQGSKEFASEYDDTIYWFKNSAHRDEFASNPDKYAPQYEGYCAIALSRGKKVEADPLAWSIKNGKLFVFFGAPGVPIFKKESASIIKKSKNNWPKLKNS
jgi:YHS domain-containing protein